MAYRLELHDGSLRYRLVPVGSRWTQLGLYLLLALVPLLTAVAATFVYASSYYQIKFNEHGVSNVATSLRGLMLKKVRGFQHLDDDDAKDSVAEKAKRDATELLPRPSSTSRSSPTTSNPRKSDTLRKIACRTFWKHRLHQTHSDVDADNLRQHVRD